MIDDFDSNHPTSPLQGLSISLMPCLAKTLVDRLGDIRSTWSTNMFANEEFCLWHVQILGIWYIIVAVIIYVLPYFLACTRYLSNERNAILCEAFSPLVDVPELRLCPRHGFRGMRELLILGDCELCQGPFRVLLISPHLTPPLLSIHNLPSNKATTVSLPHDQLPISRLLNPSPRCSFVLGRSHHALSRLPIAFYRQPRSQLDLLKW